MTQLTIEARRRLMVQRMTGMALTLHSFLLMPNA